MRSLSLPNFCLKVSKIHFTQGVSPISVKIEMKNLFQLLFGGGGARGKGGHIGEKLAQVSPGITLLKKYRMDRQTNT